jgi:hypothetical protein
VLFTPIFFCRLTVVVEPIATVVTSFILNVPAPLIICVAPLFRLIVPDVTAPGWLRFNVAPPATVIFPLIEWPGTPCKLKEAVPVVTVRLSQINAPAAAVKFLTRLTLYSKFA